MYEASTSVVPDSTAVIPGGVVLPTVRYAAPSGTLALGDTINGKITVTDSSGSIKPLDYDGEFEVRLNDWPEDPDEEILAVLKLNFVRARRP